MNVGDEEPLIPLPLLNEEAFQSLDNLAGPGVIDFFFSMLDAVQKHSLNLNFVQT